MDHHFIDRLRHTLNADVSRRLLIQYFVGKGYDNFDTLLYPAIIQDMPQVIPELADKIEVIPHSQNIDPMLDKAIIGWNLFVLGTQRQFLGETYHHGLKTLAMQLQQGQVLSEDMMATRQTTPRRIVSFITRVLETHQGGYIDLTPSTVPVMSGHGAGGSAQSQMFARSGYGT